MPAHETLDVSIVIPTRNEEAYLPNLLASLLPNEGAWPREIFVADGASDDATPALARETPRARVIDGGDHPGTGRNRGAREARSTWLLFVDADTVAPAGFLAHALSELEALRLDAATTDLCCYDSRHPLDLAIWAGNNVVQRAMQRTRHPVASGNCIFVRRSVFEASGGFDESVRYAEDVELVQRIARGGARWRVLERTHLWVTSRRFVRDGRLRTVRRFVMTGVRGVLYGPDRTNHFGVTFGHTQRPRAEDLARIRERT